MATVVTATSAPKMALVPALGTTLPAALGTSGAAYAQAEDQKIRDAVNDLRQILINAGLGK